MSFFWPWANAPENQDDGTASTSMSLQRRFDYGTASVKQLTMREIGEEWDAVKRQTKAVVSNVLKFCEFFLQDQSLVPALRQNTEHFSAHHINEGDACAQCEIVAYSVRKLHLAVVALSSLFSSIHINSDLSRRQEIGKYSDDAQRLRSFYKRHTAARYLNEVADYSTIVYRNISEVRGQLLVEAPSQKAISDIFDMVCGKLSKLNEETEKLSAIWATKFDKLMEEQKK